MTIWENIVEFFNRYLSFPNITVIDVIEIVIIALIFYKLMMWFKKTRAWSLFKGIITILVIVLLAAIFNFNTILWIASKVVSIGIIALVVIFQPELRRALDQLGRRSILRGILRTGSRDRAERFTDRTMEEVLRAVDELSRDKTGALVCIEMDVSLAEYETTGIPIDSVISSQLLVNIFEDKTPLHDGAVIIRDDRIISATVYLPMSTTQDMGKKYGTRHRAGKGVSEVTDAFTIIVSEETGEISYTYLNNFVSNVSEADLKNKLIEIQGGKGDGGELARARKKAKELKKGDEAGEKHNEKNGNDTEKMADH